ncbi:Acetyltransferase [Alkalibacterium sp. AK22]|uniref:GNAT family N-acetyltransferase n=1 Tax=Alkalibacterium sp. AK22 TaxID=1229520 RepID=UPI0004536FEA|nr:GNAT family N-acetyltransferase [Alkalibacterium sp. AK22]EXJ23066.1 Acetyltransferase [Alkalibacterium sp. AK22]
MELITDRLKLVPCSEESVLKYVCCTSDVTNNIKKCLDKINAGGKCVNSQTWLLIEKSEGTLIGDIGLAGCVETEATVEMQFEILSYARNKGYAVEAMQELFNWIFTFGGVKVVVTDCRVEDIYTEMILETLGMELVKEDSDSTRFKLKIESRQEVR